MKLLFSILFTFFITISFAQYNGESVLSLNGEWKFKTDPYGKGELLNWGTKDLYDKEWDVMPVPGNWDLRNEYAHYVGKAWYRKNFTVAKDWNNKVVRLLFEAVDWSQNVSSSYAL